MQSPQPWKPHSYQRRAAKFLLERNSAALLLDPGLGKSSIVLAALKVLRKARGAGKALIIAPLRVCYEVWPKEVTKWQDFSHFKVALLHGPGKEEALESDSDIYVINPEGLAWLFDATKSKTPGGKTRVEVNPKEFAKLGFDTLVIDELSKFKDIGTQRFKALKKVLPTFKRRWGLTGSPAANGLLGLFGQCYALDMGKALGAYFTHYRTKFFVPVDRNGFVWVPQQGAEERIYKQISPLALRMGAEEYLDLPPILDVPIRVELPDNVRKIYNQIEEIFISKIDEGVITATSASAASTKCSQISSGGVYLDPEIAPLLTKSVGPREWVHLHDAKTEALREIVEELQGKPLLVAYDFKHDLERLMEAFGRDLPYLGGGVTPKKFKAIEQAWNRGELPVLAAHPASAGHGLNLQEGSAAHIAWYTMTWDYELYDQLIRRLLRQGTKAERIINYQIVAKDTIDEVKLGVLKSKARGQDALFQALKDLAKRRRA